MGAIDSATEPIATGRRERRALVVLGMHRSGTSALTRVLSLAGARLPAHLQPIGHGLPVDGNARAGFWESKSLLELHDEALAAAGSKWDDLHGVAPSWFASESAEEFRRRLTAALSAEFADAPVFVAKDPRISYLAPLWKAALEEMGVTGYWIIAVRHPLEVAASLHRRDGFSHAKGLFLWLRYTLDAERHTRGQTRAFARYDDLLADWRGVVAGLEAQLDLSLAATAAPEIDAFLDDSLRHHAIATGDPAARDHVAEWVEDVFECVCAAAAGEGVDRERLDGIRRDLGRAEAVYGPLLTTAESELQEIRQVLAAHQSGLDWLQDRLSSAEAGLEDHVHPALDWLGRDAAARVGELRREVEAGHRDLARRVRELEAAVDDQQRAALTRLARSRRPRLWLSPDFGVWGLISKAPFWLLRGRLRSRWRRWHQTRRIFASGLFDRGFYLRRYPEVAAAGIDPLVHYVRYGAAEGRDPNRAFDGRRYLERHPQLIASGGNPLHHYLVHAASGADDGGSDLL